MRFMDPDARLFGLRIWRKKLSDAEFVDKIRRSSRHARWYRYFQALMGVGVLVMLCWTIKILYEEVVRQGAPPAQQLNAFVAFVLAIFAGLSVGSFASHVAHSTFQLLVEQRKDRLLVTCWDALQQLLTEQSLQDIQENAVSETEDT